MLRIKHIFAIVVLSGMIPNCRPIPSKQVLTTTDYKSRQDSIRVLNNPHKGWYHHYYDNGTGKYGIGGDGITSGRDSDEFEMTATFPLMDHLYLRLAWSYLEPEEDVFNWHLIDRVVKKYVPVGYGIAFRITCRETGSYPESTGQYADGLHYATPKWVRDAGAKGIEIPAENDLGSAPSWAPDYGDSVFLKKLDNFHRAFAARYDGKTWIRYIDIGSVGDWGEGHTHFSTRQEVPNEVLKKHIDLYTKHYKKSPLVMVEGFIVYRKEPLGEGRYSAEPAPKVKEIYEYAKNKGIWLRSDSFMVDYYMGLSAASWSVTRPYLFDRMYRYKPVIYEPEHYGYVKKAGNWKGKNGAIANKYGYPGATFMEKSMESAHATYIGYHGYLKDWLEDNPELTKRLANRCGYWYFPIRAQYSAETRHHDNKLLIAWQNKGVAPAYHTYALILRFSRRESSFDIEIPDSGNRHWLPDTIYTCTYTYSIPENAKPGKYRLSMKLYDKQTSTTIKSAIKSECLTTDEFIPVGEIRLR